MDKKQSAKELELNNFLNIKELKSELKVANEEFTNCISKDFLKQFLDGAKIRIEDYCVPERARMEVLDK